MQSIALYQLLIVGFLLLAIALRITNPQLLVRMRHMTFDTYQQLLPRTSNPKTPVAIVTIDEASLQAHGQWPWPRTLMAKLIDKLNGAGAAAIGVDVIFPEPDRLSPEQIIQLWKKKAGHEKLLASAASYGSHDDIFARSIDKAPVVLGFIGTNVKAGERPLQKSGIVFLGNRPHDFVASFEHATSSLKKLQQKAKGTGALNWFPEHDQIIRKLPMLTRIDDRLYASLSAELLRVAQGAGSPIVRSSDAHAPGPQSSKTGLVSMKVGSITIPLSADGTVWLRPRFTDNNEYISAHDVLYGTIAPDKIQGRIVLIGAHAAGLGDVQATALQEAVPGVALHAQALEQILEQDFLLRPDYILGLELAYMIVLGLLLAWMIHKYSAGVSAFFTAMAIIAALAIGWFAFSSAGWLIDSIYPVLVLAGIYTLGTLYQYWRTERERTVIRNAFSHYLAPQYVTRLMENPQELTLGGEMRDLTVMFCDVRGFTSLSEHMDASALNQFINRLFSPLARTITQHDGTIDKFIGDAVMAFWNAPVDIGDHPVKASKAALAMLEDVKQLNRELTAQYEEETAKGGCRDEKPPVVRVGIGFNRGPCCVGNLGSLERFDYSAIGDSVNIASRIEALTKTYGVDILVTQSVADAAPQFAYLEVDEVQVKGRKEPVRIYALLGDEAEKQSDKFQQLYPTHKAMLDAMKKDDTEKALVLLEDCKAFGFEGLEELYTVYMRRLSSFDR